MAIQYIGQATGTNTAILPTHQSGDLILAFAFRDGSTIAPTLPANWTNIRNDGANVCSGRIAYRVATSSDTVSGTWTNATSVVFLIYRDTNTSSPIGNTNTATASSVTVNYPALSVSQDSIVVGFAGHVSANVNLVAPNGMTNRAYVADATDEAAGHDTNGAVSSWNSTNTSVGGTTAGWRSYVVEVKSAISTNVSIEGVETTSFAGEWLQTSNDWYAWAFDRSFILLSSADANTNLLDTELSSNAQEIQAFVSIDASTTINGIDLGSQTDFVATNASGNVTCSDIVATTYIQEVFSTGDAYSTTNSTQINAEFGSIFENADSKHTINGIVLVSETGNVLATEVTSADAQVLIEGILLGINQGNVSASALNEEIIQLSGNPKRYAANEFKYAKVEIAGISTKISTGAVKAIGSVSISARANVQSVGIKSQVPTICADGVKWITEDELMTLLAA